MFREREIWIVKAGSSSVSDHELGLNTYLIDSMARQLSSLWLSGKHVVLVSSGAVAAGRERRKMNNPLRFNSVDEENLADKTGFGNFRPTCPYG